MQAFINIYFNTLVFLYYTRIFVFMERNLITITEFSKNMGVTRDTIYKWIQNNKLPKGVRVKKVAGRNFISIPDQMFRLNSH